MSRFRAHCLALAVACALLWAGNAAAAVSNLQVTSAPNDATPSFSWTGDSLSGFDWELAGPVARSGSAVLSSVEVAPAVPDGAYSFRVREVVFGTPGEWSPAVGVTIDTVAPVITIRSPAQGQTVESGTRVIADYQCDGAVACQSGVAAGQPIPTVRAGARTFTVQARDAAGNTSQASVTWRVVDTVPPTAAVPRAPVQGTVLGVVRPTLRWNAASDVQGIANYELFVDGVRRARVDRGQLTWRTNYDLADGAHTWYVRAFDLSGNASTSVVASFGLDLDAPEPPALTEAPPDVTTDITPTFSWLGVGPTYTYTLLSGDGGPPAIPATTTRSSTVTLGPLGDGEYVFRLAQANAFNRRSSDVELAFAVDTIAPGPPEVTSGPPPSSTDPMPAFSWTPAEPGGTFSWRILAGGAVVQAAATATPEITAGPLSPGAYAFVVQQIDDAGNVGAPSAPSSFEIAGAATGLVAAASSPPRRARPATLTPRRLRPAAGARVKGKSVTLRWQPGPAGTRLYNLQIFRITKNNKVAKVLSSFPRRNEFTVPRVRLKGGARYVWRVWPYLGAMKLAKRPVGVSFFDVVKRKRPPATGK